MAESPFITHAQVIPTFVAPRNTGVFTALAVVFVILIGSLTVGVIFLKNNFDVKVKEKEAELAKLKDDFNIPDLVEAQKLQQRILYAQQVLASHVYGSQALNFLEAHTIDGLRYKSFKYSGNMITVSAIASGYLPYAEEVRHLRKVSAIEKFTAGTPQLDELTGEVTFSIDITLTSDWLHEKPSRIGATVQTTQ